MSFVHYKHDEECRNKRLIFSGYSVSLRLKDPRTGQNYNYSFAMESFYGILITRENLVHLFMGQIANITEGECHHFFSPGDRVGIIDITLQLR